MFFKNIDYFFKKFGYILVAFCIGVFVGGFGTYHASFYSFEKDNTYEENNDIVVSSDVTNNIFAKEKLVKYYEITEEDLYNVFHRFIKEANFKYAKVKDEQYVKDVALAYVNQVQYVPHPELVFYTMAMGKKESKFDITAKPPKHLNSSASGIGQVIWRWHGEKLSKEYPWREGVITKESLDTDICASIDAKYIVFENYLRNNEYNYKKASHAYLGMNQTEVAKSRYRLEILNDYHLLTQRLFRVVLNKEPKVKIVHVDKKGEIICEYPVDPRIKF